MMMGVWGLFDFVLGGFLPFFLFFSLSTAGADRRCRFFFLLSHFVTGVRLFRAT